jgi:hypothetical protein
VVVAQAVLQGIKDPKVRKLVHRVGTCCVTARRGATPRQSRGKGGKAKENDKKESKKTLGLIKNNDQGQTKP